MEDKFHVKNKEQMDVMTDPFAIDIIQLLDNEESVTKEWIASELGENLKIISEYVDMMLATGFLVKDKEKSTQDKVYYKKTAKSFDGSELLFKGELDRGWISGFINYLENSMIDFFDYINNIEGDRREYLTDNGYSDKLLSDFSKVYLTKEEYEELFSYLRDFILEKSSKERKNDKKYKAYNMFTFLFPYLKNKRNE